MMETSAEACWRLSKACGQWAVESRDSAARIAFRQMATEWARLAFNEEFISPVGEQIDPPTSENSEATPVEILASSLPTPSSENAQPEVELRLDETRQETVLAAKPLFKAVGQVAFTLSTTLADRPVCGGWRP
jgi:hypothetical protein